MPSDDRSARALTALKRSRDVFHSAVVAAIDELTAFLSEQRAPVEQRSAQEAVRLGVFGADRLDIDRFSQIVGAAETLDPRTLDALEHALRVLRGFVPQGDDLSHTRVRRGADLRDTIRDALAARGRAFNTAHQIELLRTGRSGVLVELEYGTLDYRHWTRLERTLAPPLVVEVNGADFRAAALSEYMDGSQKLVFIVDGAVAPAPLVRLIAPSTFVMQTTDVAALDRFAAWGGPGIAAVMPEGCAVFAHDPARGPSLAQRLTVESLPKAAPRGVGGGSARQQAEDLAWLKELANVTAPAASNGAGAPSAPAAVAVTPADQLAAWLLRQTDLTAAE
jgi:hypothetical protein